MVVAATATADTAATGDTECLVAAAAAGDTECLVAAAAAICDTECLREAAATGTTEGLAGAAPATEDASAPGAPHLLADRADASDSAGRVPSVSVCGRLARGDAPTRQHACA